MEITKYYAKPIHNTWAKTGYLFNFGEKGKWFLCEYLSFNRPALMEKFYEQNEPVEDIVYGGYQKFDKVDNLDEDVNFENMINELYNKGLIKADSELDKFYKSQKSKGENSDVQKLNSKQFHIRYLGVQNFRNLNAFTEFEFRGISFVTGRNNSGKSSVLKAFLLLAELHYDPRLDAFVINDSKGLNLEMNELASHQSAQDNIKIAINLNFRLKQYVNEQLKIEFSFQNIQDDKCLILKDVVVDFVDKFIDHKFILKLSDIDGAKKLEIETAVIEDLEDSLILVYDFDKSVKGLGFNTLFNLQNEALPLINLLSNFWNQEKINISETLLSELEGLFADIADIVGQNLKNNIVHVKSLRSENARSFDEEKSQLGETLGFLNTANPNSVEMNKLYDWLKEFGLDKKWKVDKLPNGSYKLIFEKRNIADLGFGYMQIFTVLVQSIFAAYNGKSIVVIEEPESNLHPNLQSKLAELFHDIHNEFGTQFIIETHSEYMIRKCQVIIKNNPESFHKYLIHYVQDEKNGNSYQIYIHRDGYLSEVFQPNFFDESLNNINELL